MAITVKEVRFRTYICFPLNINLQKDNKMSVSVCVCVCVCVTSAVGEGCPPSPPPSPLFSQPSYYHKPHSRDNTHTHTHTHTQWSGSPTHLVSRLYVNINLQATNANIYSMWIWKDFRCLGDRWWCLLTYFFSSESLCVEHSRSMEGKEEKYTYVVHTYMHQQTPALYSGNSSLDLP